MIDWHVAFIFMPLIGFILLFALVLNDAQKKGRNVAAWGLGSLVFPPVVFIYFIKNFIDLAEGTGRKAVFGMILMAVGGIGSVVVKPANDPQAPQAAKTVATPAPTPQPKAVTPASVAKPKPTADRPAPEPVQIAKATPQSQPQHRGIIVENEEGGDACEEGYDRIVEKKDTLLKTLSGLRRRDDELSDERLFVIINDESSVRHYNKGVEELQADFREYKRQKQGQIDFIDEWLDVCSGWQDDRYANIELLQQKYTGQ